jgi:hypothetical protein
MKTNKFKIMLAGMCALIAMQAQAQDFGGRNGGDPMELQFREVAMDIQQWIAKGGAQALVLSSTVSLADYQTKMNSALTDGVVSFTTNTITVNGVEKACMNQPAQKLIQCNVDRFNATTESEKYVLVHHEYAGLAGLETNTGAKSDYSISEQLTASLEKVTVLKLAVKSAPTVFTGTDYEKARQLYEHAINNPSETIGTICENSWVENAVIRSTGTEMQNGSRFILTFCQTKRNPISGQYEIVHGATPLANVLGLDGIRYPAHTEFAAHWFNSWGKYVLSKDLKSLLATPVYYSISNKVRKQLGWTHLQAYNVVPPKVNCTVTRAPLSVICQWSFDPLLNWDPIYLTYLKYEELKH